MKKFKVVISFVVVFSTYLIVWNEGKAFVDNLKHDMEQTHKSLGID